MKKYLLCIIIFTSSLSLFFSCDNTTEPPPPPPDEEKPAIITSIEDVSCTEVWLKLKITELHDTVEVAITRDDTVIINFKANNDIDTTLYDENLLPNKTYKYKAMISIMEDSISSNEINAITMDTTSHNFTWQTFTFGEAVGYNSVLYDVAIISEDNIWAVGEIYINDSLGNPDPIFYNLAVWDGKSWELKRIFYKGGIWTIRTIFAFNENDIWLSGYVRYLNGNFIELPIPDILMGWGINKLWGTSSNDLYAVGDGGNIAHYQNGIWRKIESGTDVDLLDVWGSPDGNVVFFCGYTTDYHTTTLLKYNKKNIIKLFEGNPDEINNGYYIGPIKSLWGNKNNRIYVMSWGGIYIQNNIDTIFYSKEIANFSDVGYSIRGIEVNDIWISGQHGLLGHYNGSSYKEFSQFYNNKIYLYSIAVKDNVVCTVGYNYSGIINNGAIIYLINK